MDDPAFSMGQVVLTAVELALSEGVATKTHVLDIRHRLIDEKATDRPTIDTPQALRSCQRHAFGVIRDRSGNSAPLHAACRADPASWDGSSTASALPAARCRTSVPGYGSSDTLICIATGLRPVAAANRSSSSVTGSAGFEPGRSTMYWNSVSLPEIS